MDNEANERGRLHSGEPGVLEPVYRESSIVTAPDPRRSEFLAGAAHTAPLLLGTAPIAAIFGALAGANALSWPAALAMSLLVFTGSAQFIALGLLMTGTGLGVIAFSTGVVNLRHALYSAALRPHVAHLPVRWRAALAFLLSDEAFVMAQARYRAPGNAMHRHWYFLGSGLSMYVNWALWTAVGLWLGASIEGLQALGLEFAMAATIVAMVAPLLKRRAALAAAIAATAVAVAAAGLPYKAGLMLAVIVGVATGAGVEHVDARRQAKPSGEGAADDRH